MANYVADGYVDIGYAEGTVSSNYVADGYVDIGYAEGTVSSNYVADGYVDIGYAVSAEPSNYVADGYVAEGYAEGETTSNCVSYYMADGYVAGGYVAGETTPLYVEDGYVAVGYTEGCLLDSSDVLILPTLTPLTLTTNNPVISTGLSVIIPTYNLSIIPNEVNIITPKINRRVLSLGGVVFDFKLFITNEFNSQLYVGQEELNSDGAYNEQIKPKGTHSKLHTITSDGHGWVLYSTILKLQELSPVGIHEIVFDDGTTSQCYFNHAENYIEKENLYRGAEWYTLSINIIEI